MKTLLAILIIGAGAYGAYIYFGQNNQGQGPESSGKPAVVPTLNRDKLSELCKPHMKGCGDVSVVEESILCVISMAEDKSLPDPCRNIYRIRLNEAEKELRKLAPPERAESPIDWSKFARKR